MTSTKSKILALLEGNRGQALSGSDIAKKLHLSRSAVWKSIEELRKEGYDIQATTNKGYSLSESSDILSAEGITSLGSESYHNTGQDPRFQKHWVYKSGSQENGGGGRRPGHHRTG